MLVSYVLPCFTSNLSSRELGTSAAVCFRQHDGFSRTESLTGERKRGQKKIFDGSIAKGQVLPRGWLTCKLINTVVNNVDSLMLLLTGETSAMVLFRNYL